MRSDDVPYALLTLLPVLLVLGLLVRNFFKRPPVGTALDPVRALPPGSPRCQTECAELATEPAPRLERGRGSFLRDFLSMPPTYRRVVDGPPAYCPRHAHLADSKVTEFLATERARLSSAYAGFAHRAATFEQEELPRMMRESLTEQQKKDARRPAPVVPIRRADEG
jgi:hypothetical protein